MKRKLLANERILGIINKMGVQSHQCVPRRETAGGPTMKMPRAQPH